ncbi:hypothetical protein EBZ39_00635 [bacterium]|nr:hypothetical protein [bacterium]
MPRYAGQNLAAVNPEFRKANNLDSSGKKNTRYTYGKNVLIAAGKPMASGLCLRLLPVLEEAQVPGNDRNFVNFREGKNNEVFGDWSRLMTCANWVGNPGVCFVIHDGNPERNIYDSPYMVLRNVAYKHKDTPGIGRLFAELIANQRILDSHIGSAPKADKILFISASTVYVNDNGQIVLGAFAGEERKDAKVIGLKFSAAQSLYNILNCRDEETGEFLSGDLLSLGNANLITILPESFQSGAPNLMAASSQGPVGFQCPKYARGDKNAKYIVGKPEKPSSMTHFAIMHSTYNGQGISLEPHVDTLLADTQTWDDRVYVPSYEEQAELMAPAFPREALEFAWREHPEYIRALAKGTVTSYGSSESDEDDEAVNAAFTRKPAAASKPLPPAADPVDMRAPWDPPAEELTPEEEAGVADMFSAPVIPAGAATAPPPAPAPATAPKASGNSSADILARARARAASNR